ncbi:MAG: Ig-like domain-containing protein [Thiomicrorhabdus chilensis]|uniref:Ig-like domain-containing protein n=1 Tax=Thiomicrorhabdus chilensis TaxID=63656 RepID=UPI00299E11EE|nr:Ig-like domain-containing protein [Thiomicrorhabdus chilensis]MDX1347256.1 Ig-like domain-containing protein [Thiomicrorhabdus chilensis]
MVKFLKWFGLLVSILTLAGCGGSAGGDGEAQFYEPGINLSMSISSTGETTTTIPANDDAKVDIIFLSEGGLPLDNEIITLSATSGTLSQTSVLTNNVGRATVTIYSPDIESGTAPGILTANSTAFDGEAATLNYQFSATISDDGANTSSAGSIQFISADPEFMSLKGTGGVGYGETSQVVFKVVDIFGSPIEGATVNFTLSTTVGGLSLSPSSATSNASGLVSTTVQAGTISTPVRVGASVTLSDGQLIYVQSDLLTVTTGIPDQNSISLSMDKFAPEGWDFDGETVTVTVRLGDRFNNPVPDGTVINFTTEGGLIESSCQTSDSACSVVWTSQAPRPADHRSTVMAYAIGHETYYDHNANGVFDDGDVFDDMGETFRDDDESGTYNPSSGNGFSIDEKLIDYDENAVYTGPDGDYNGVPCEHTTDCPIDANNVAGRSNFLTNVRDSGLIIMADSAPNVRIYELLSGTSCLNASGKLVIDNVQCGNVSQNFAAGVDQKTIWVLIEDTAALCKTSAVGDRVAGVVNPDAAACTYAVRQSAPTGASISVTTDVGELSTIPYSAVPNTTGHLEFVFTVTSDDENADPQTGALEVKVSTPVGGVDVAASVGLTDPIN